MSAKNKLKSVMSRNKTRRVQKGGAVIYTNAIESWYKKEWDNKIYGDKPILDSSNMNNTYQNRRTHLKNWMIKILIDPPDDNYLSQIFKNNETIIVGENQWSCSSCTTLNEQNKEFCNTCSNPKNSAPTISNTTFIEEHWKSDNFRICHKSSKFSHSITIDTDLYLSKTKGMSIEDIKKLQLVNYYANDYSTINHFTSNLMNQNDPAFLIAPKFNETEYGFKTNINLIEMNSSGHDNSCGFHAFLQAISPLFCALNASAKKYVAHEFRNNYIPDVIINANGAEMNSMSIMTTDNIETNELLKIRDEYNGKIIASDLGNTYNDKNEKIPFIYIFNNKNPDENHMSKEPYNAHITPVHIVSLNSQFFGFNVLLISTVNQIGVKGNYGFTKFSPLYSTSETIIINNPSSIHYRTIGHDNKFIFDENDENIKNMIDSVKTDSAPSTAITPVINVIFNGIETKFITRKILSDDAININITIRTPKNDSEVFEKNIHDSIKTMKIFIDETNKPDYPGYADNKISCDAYDTINKKYYYVLDYQQKGDDETYNVAKIENENNNLKISNYKRCGIIEYNNKTGKISINLNECNAVSTSASSGGPKTPVNTKLVGMSGSSTSSNAQGNLKATTNLKQVVKVIQMAKTLAPPAPQPQPQPPSLYPIIVTFNSGIVNTVNINVDNTKCKSTPVLPTDKSAINDKTEYLVFGNFDHTKGFITDIDFSQDKTDKCDNNLHDVITNSSTPAANPAANPAASAAASASANPSTNTSTKSSNKSSNILPSSVNTIIAISNPNPGANVANIQNNDDDIKAFVINNGSPTDIKNMEQMLTDGRISKVDVKFTEGDCTGCTALMSQSHKGTIEAMNFLLQNGANVNLQDKHGDTALYYILLNADTDDNVAKVKLLLEKGAKVDITNSEGKTALVRAQELGRTKSLKAIEDFIKQQNVISPDDVIVAVAGNAIN